MNRKTRKALLIATITQGMEARIYAVMQVRKTPQSPAAPIRMVTQILKDNYHQRQVTRTTPHNCYLDNVRHSWTDIEAIVHRGEVEFFHAGAPVKFNVPL